MIHSYSFDVDCIVWVFYVYFMLVVWLSDNALVVINEVTLRQARLIQGWVTVCGQVNHLGM